MARKRYQPPANLLEHSDQYELLLVAPGRSREDFRLTVKDEVLTISGQQPEGSTDERQWMRQEYRLESFERKFLLNKKIDLESISATYADGILQVLLPKVPGADAPDQEIMVG